MSMTPGPFRTTCATSFRAHQATVGRVPATDAGCGLSTRGHWDGPAICKEWKGGCRHSATCSTAWIKVPCEHANSSYSGPASPIFMACTTITWIFRLCLSRLSFGPNMRLCIVPVVCLRGGKYGALPLFWGFVGQNGGVSTTRDCQYF